MREQKQARKKRSGKRCRRECCVEPGERASLLFFGCERKATVNESSSGCVFLPGLGQAARLFCASPSVG